MTATLTRTFSLLMSTTHHALYASITSITIHPVAPTLTKRLPAHKLTPQTGSAHATLVGYYLTGAGRDAITPHIPAGANTEDVTLEARQLSKRGGGLTCTLRDGMAYVIGRGWRYGSGTLEVFE